MSDAGSYDAVIIGAGLGGLICGCYLAKAGMKVLIAEQHRQPGGYCTSFRRGVFAFDAAAHSFGGFREGGIVKRVFVDLGIDGRLEINRYDPSDIIISPDYHLEFRSNIEETIEDFQKAFPHESNGIKAFFHFLRKNDLRDFAGLRNQTFKVVLDRFLSDSRLKSLLAFPLLGNGGLPPSRMSAFIGARLFIDFLIDGGYYPKGGMQVVPDMLATRFKEFGGTLLLSACVNKILVDGNKVAGVQYGNKHVASSKVVVSNCDARQTFLTLMKEQSLEQTFSEKLCKMTPSLSMFVVYLGVDKKCNTLPKSGTNYWYLPHYDLEKMYTLAKRRNIANIAEYMVRLSPNGRALTAFINAAYHGQQYWKKHKRGFLDRLIQKIDHHTIPGLTKCIRYKDAASPYTLFRYTRNVKGAAYGWACSPSQFIDADFKRPSFLRGLFLTGHWTTQGMGIPSVAYTGLDTANYLLKKMRMGS